MKSHLQYVVFDTQFGEWIVQPTMTTKHISQATHFANKAEANRAAKSWDKIMGREFKAAEIRPVLPAVNISSEPRAMSQRTKLAAYNRFQRMFQ
jgi:hypothetical protein